MYPRDPYSDETIAYNGWPIAVDRETQSFWPVHCYAMVGVARDMSPNTGTSSELYTVIGHAPRHLDRNIALVGRVIAGRSEEHTSELQSLMRISYAVFCLKKQKHLKHTVQRSTPVQHNIRNQTLTTHTIKHTQ